MLALYFTHDFAVFGQMMSFSSSKRPFSPSILWTILSSFNQVFIKKCIRHLVGRPNVSHFMVTPSWGFDLLLLSNIYIDIISIQWWNQYFWSLVFSRHADLSICYTTKNTWALFYPLKEKERKSLSERIFFFLHVSSLVCLAISA